MPLPTAITDFEAIAQVLGKNELAPVAYGERHRALGAHLGIDTSQIDFAIAAIPLCQRGSVHSETRRRLAKLIADTAPAADRYLSENVPKLLRATLTPGRHDVIGEFISPCVNGLLGVNIGIDLTIAHDSMVSRIFSQSIGVAKRKRLNDDIGNLRHAISAARPDLSENAVADRVALVILGNDALRGTLGKSLHAIFSGEAKAESAGAPPRTGVPYIDREVLVAQTFSGQLHPAGTILRATLSVLNDADNTEARLRFFGFGPHTCLGRRLSLGLWRQIEKTLAEVAPKVKVVSYSMRKDDVFDIPETFEIEVTP